MISSSRYIIYLSFCGLRCKFIIPLPPFVNIFLARSEWYDSALFWSKIGHIMCSYYIYFMCTESQWVNYVFTLNSLLRNSNAATKLLQLETINNDLFIFIKTNASVYSSVVWIFLLSYIYFVFPIYICFVSVNLQFLLLLFVVPFSLPPRLKNVSFYHFISFWKAATGWIFPNLFNLSFLSKYLFIFTL